jgi:hypothetical protein
MSEIEVINNSEGVNGGENEVVNKKSRGRKPKVTPEQKKEYQKKYREQNKDKMKQYREEHKEQIANYESIKYNPKKLEASKKYNKKLQTLFTIIKELYYNNLLVINDCEKEEAVKEIFSNFKH